MLTSIEFNRSYWMKHLEVGDIWIDLLDSSTQLEWHCGVFDILFIFVFTGAVPVTIRPPHPQNLSTTLPTVRMIVEVSKASVILSNQNVIKLLKSKVGIASSLSFDIIHLEYAFIGFIVIQFYRKPEVWWMSERGHRRWIRTTCQRRSWPTSIEHRPLKCWPISTSVCRRRACWPESKCPTQLQRLCAVPWSKPASCIHPDTLLFVLILIVG